MDYEVLIDRQLNIKTNGRDDTNSNYVNYPYEPTPYVVLERLANSGYITKKDKIIDYGSGKGRVDFYLSAYTKAYMYGIEYDERLYNASLVNKCNALKSSKVEFFHVNASIYNVCDDVTGAYFFNPFSIKVLNDVIKKLKESIIRNNRTIKLFFYYPSNKYIDYLSTINEISLIDDIDCMDLFNEDSREHILVYEINKC